jgi:two-component system, chemotaxis family, chemotaxis protein CheY
MQILVVDDSRTMRMLVTRTLRQAGYGGHNIVEAGDGLEALEVIRTVGADIVLCDWNMPRMSGLELLKLLRNHGDLRPFGFVTSEGTPAMREVAEKEGANFVITKPFTADVFSSVLGGVQAVTGVEPSRQGLPNAHHLFKVLDTLLGRAVATRDSTTTVDHERAALVWSYVFEDGGLAAAGAIDLRLAAILAAGFGLLPQGRVADALESGVLPKDLEENLREVFNILVALYTPMSDDHITLGGVWRRGVSDVSPEVADLLSCRTRRLDAVVSITGYGEGCLSAVPAWRLVRREPVAMTSGPALKSR